MKDDKEDDTVRYKNTLDSHDNSLSNNNNNTSSRLSSSPQSYNLSMIFLFSSLVLILRFFSLDISPLNFIVK